MRSRKALDVGKVLKHLYGRVSFRRTAVDDVEQNLEHRYEQESDEERHDLSQQYERQSEPELLLGKGVADIHDVQNNEHNTEDYEIEEDEESSVVYARHEGIN